MSERQFARDLRQLRKIGDGFGLRISNQQQGRVRLEAVAGKNRLQNDLAGREAVLRIIARAVGAPVARELGIAGEAEPVPSFISFAIPDLIEGSAVADIFDALRDAHRSSARVRFAYRTGEKKSVREAEPYRVLVRSGRYYLIAFDIAPRKGWRYFALDQIAGPVARAGTFRPRSLPATYENADTVGMLQGGSAVDVTVRLSPLVAASATSRSWQKSQRVEERPDGSADITFTVNDIGEVIRWALGFGAEAEVIAPASAAQAARDTVVALQRIYGRRTARSVAV